MIYEKNNYIPLTHNRYEQCFEYMFVFSKGKPRVFNPLKFKNDTAGASYNLRRKGYCATIKEGAQRRRDEVVTVKDEKIRPNIFQYNCGSIITGHPAPFPEQLPADMIYSFSNEGDIVYEPFAGSGTTCKMALLQKRKFIASEISKDYADSATKRIAPYLTEQYLF